MVTESNRAYKVALWFGIAAFVLGLILFIWQGDWGFFSSLILSLIIALIGAVVVYLCLDGEAATTEAARPTPVDTQSVAAVEPVQSPIVEQPEPVSEVEPVPEPVEAVAETSFHEDDYDRDGVVEGENEGTRPAALDGPRDGKADDLKQIKGVGPKMEKTCNSLGFYHFDQIASWTKDEIAWVDANLEGFKGRVTRDTWVEQARILAAGGETEFSKRVDDGDVY